MLGADQHQKQHGVQDLVASEVPNQESLDLFLTFFFGNPEANRSSRVRDWIRVTAVTCAAAVAMADP